MQIRPGLSVDRSAIEAFCLKNRVRRLAVFGSALGEDFGPHSDVDLLVEFEAGATPGMVRLAGLERELESLFGNRRVDLRTSGDLSRYFREQVLAAAVPLYDAAA